MNGVGFFVAAQSFFVQCCRIGDLDGLTGFAFLTDEISEVDRERLPDARTV